MFSRDDAIDFRLVSVNEDVTCALESQKIVRDVSAVLDLQIPAIENAITQ